MTDLRELWDDGEPAKWAAAARDRRAMLAAREAPFHPGGREGLAAELGHRSGPSKVGQLVKAWERLDDAAEAGDPAARERVSTAMDLDQLIRNRAAARNGWTLADPGQHETAPPPWR